MLTIKNYKKLEGWAHDYKDLRIGEIIETENEYTFRVGYNSTPYTIKVFRPLIGGDYEMVLRDGSDITQYGREWIDSRRLKSFELTTSLFEALIIKYQPKARGINNPFYNNGPF